MNLGEFDSVESTGSVSHLSGAVALVIIVLAVGLPLFYLLQ